jgi:outer membrane protein assembly factor BamA
LLAAAPRLAAQVVSVEGVPDAGPCLGHPLADVRVTACTLDRCADPDFVASLVGSLGLLPGLVLQVDDLARASGRLAALQVFRGIELRCVAASGDPPSPAEGLVAPVVLELSLEGRYVVDDVTISGHRDLYKSDILKRTYLRAGQYLEDASPDAEAFRSQARALEALHEREGFEGAKVEVVPVPLPNNRVRVEIRIQPGLRHVLERIDVTLGEPDPSSGCAALGESEVRSAFGLKAGATLTPKVLKDARRALLARLWAHGATNARVTTELDEEGSIVRLAVHHSQCWRVQFWTSRDDPARPYVPADPSDWRDVLTFKESGTFDWEEAEIGRLALIDHLRERGYVDARVTMEVRTLPTDGSPAVLGQVDYFLDLGRPPTIDRITFVGREHLAESDLRELMQTEEYSLFSQGGTLLVEQLFSDLGRIAERYRAEGFHAFAFEGARADDDTRQRIERNPDPAVGGPGDQGTEREVWRWSRGELAFDLVRRKGKGGVEVQIRLLEGPRSVLEAVDVAGASRLSEERLRRALGLTANLPWSLPVLQRLEGALRNTYSARGFSMMTFESRCAAREPDVEWGPCDVDRLKSRRVLLRFTIDEGEKAVVRHVFVFGNRVTRSSFVLASLPKPGEPYDIERVRAGITDLRNTGLFASVQASALGPDEQPPSRDVTLVVHVEELDYQTFDVAAGFETINRPGESAPAFVSTLVRNSVAVADASLTGNEEPFLTELPDLLITAEVAYTNMNFLGRARQLYVPLKYGFSMTHPLRYASFAPMYTDPYFTRPRLTLQVSPFVTYDRATEAIDKALLGLTTALSKSFLGHFHVSLGYEISEITYRLPGDPVRGDWSPWGLQNKVNLRGSITYLDNPIHPTRGVFLGASTTYLNALQQGDFRNFVKWDLQVKGFLPVRRWLVIGSMARYADSRSFEGAALPDYERYKLGGSKGLRGFDDDAVTQYYADGSLRYAPVETVDGETRAVQALQPFGGDVLIQGSEELRVPIWRAMGLWAGGFFDWGAVAERAVELHAKSFRTSAGFGLRWLLGGQVPLRIDYGFKLERRCEKLGYADPANATAADEPVCLAKENLGALHFGFLYTF